MNQLAQTGVVAAVCDGALKRTFDATADRAAVPAIVVILGVSRKDSFAANRAEFAAYGMN
jgi:hypothetical protein